MPLNFHPGPGTILICDFSTGFLAPEMVKVRPVVVISPRRRAVQGLVSIVPLSSVAPEPVEPWHYLLPPGCYPLARGPIWAKCDMVAAVALRRLDRVMVRREGKRSYQAFQMGGVEFAAVQAGVRAALGLG